jgi:hypothetical protein
MRMHAVLASPVNTDMSRNLDDPKAAPASVAAANFDGVQNQQKDLFSDPTSATLAPS